MCNVLRENCEIFLIKSVTHNCKDSKYCDSNLISKAILCVRQINHNNNCRKTNMLRHGDGRQNGCGSWLPEEKPSNMWHLVLSSPVLSSTSLKEPSVTQGTHSYSSRLPALGSFYR